MAGQFGFVLEDVEELPFTPVRGLQRLFDLDEPLATRRTRIVLEEELAAGDELPLLARIAAARERPRP
jgi:hypothetical protein